MLLQSTGHDKGMFLTMRSFSSLLLRIQSIQHSFIVLNLVYVRVSFLFLGTSHCRTRGGDEDERDFFKKKKLKHTSSYIF